MKARTTLSAWSRLWAAQSGDSLVDLSVITSLLVLILLGAVEFGQVAYASIEVANAAMAGAQYGAESGFTAIDSTGIQNAAAGAAADLSGLTATPSHSCVCSDGSASTCQNTDCANSHIEETVTVDTTATITPIIRMPGFPTSFSIKGSAVQKCAQ